MMTSRHLYCAVVTAIVLHCALPGMPAADAVSPEVPAVEGAKAAGPLTEEECVAFGEEIAQAFNGGKSDEVIAAFDSFALSERVLRGIELDQKTRQGFQTSFVSSSRATLGREFKNFAKARFLRVQHVAGEKRALVRVLTPAGAMNYYAFVVARRANGRAKWVDVHIYLSGELMSESMRRLVLPAFAGQNAGLLERLTRGENAYVKSIAEITKVQPLMQAGKMSEAVAVLNSLPEEVRTSKAILALHLRAAQKLGETEYLAVLDDWARCYPNDPSLELIGIDADFLRKDYAGVVRRLDALQRLLGGDPYLEYLKANTQLMAGRAEESRAAARRALAEDPRMSSAYDVLLQLELNAKNFPAVAALLDEVEAAFPGADMAASIAGLAAYADFRASPENARWLEARANRMVPAVK